MTIRGFFFAAAVMSGVAAATGAWAGEDRSADTPPSVRVSYADLDLSSTAGSEALAARIKHAAGEVCGRWSAAYDFETQRGVRRCMSTATTDAMAQVRSQQIALGKAPLKVAQADAPAR